MRTNLLPLVGRRLRRDLMNHSGVTLVPSGVILTKEHLQLIHNHGISFADIVKMTEQTAYPHDLLIQEASEEMREVFHSMKINERVPIEDISNKVLPSLYHMAESVDLSGLLSGIQSKDDYTYRHNIGVGVISTMIGKWLRLSNEDLEELTLAATLHDVGKVWIPDNILNKTGKFTPEELAVMKQHAQLGYNILRRTPGTSERVALVALQHHEREDGGGYPYGIQGNRIDFFSKIVAVADVFHAMSTNRVYRGAIPFFKVVSTIAEGGYTQFDPMIAAVFTQRMMELAIGSTVILSDGREGTIRMVHASDPLHPLVQLGTEYIDLHQQRSISLVHIS
ncbi:HD-GYP domain-containing protein [Paenibacillus cremeus]|uniref:HD-GYP domain-containing protein n=1 Tax=Paenibacillus cremeus TaxID=2163881 RepID=A0A559KC80_9BACL|nr:HD-GYP domain-containing protein [Paenibacillus cremeus]TVY09713.1 HD-GYP domain-containing protein [Paenibacillus cremeus]